jgi:hypothetical protein
MNPHLTPQQISEWVLGMHTAEVERHVRSCSLCQSELGRFDASLKGFRTTVRQWSDQQLPPLSPQLGRNPARVWTMRLGWAMALIALCLFISRLNYHHASRQQAGENDAALLAQIDHEVSRTVPGPMEPLTQLVSWDADSMALAGGKTAPESQAQ